MLDMRMPEVLDVEVSDQLGKEVTSLAPTRSQLLATGMVWGKTRLPLSLRL